MVCPDGYGVGGNYVSLSFIVDFKHTIRLPTIKLGNVLKFRKLYEQRFVIWSLTDLFLSVFFLRLYWKNHFEYKNEKFDPTFEK